MWPWLLLAGCTEERLTVGVGAPDVVGAGGDSGRSGSAASEANAATGSTGAATGGAPAGSGIPSGGLSGGGTFGGGMSGGDISSGGRVIDNASGSSGAGGVSMTGSGAAGQDAGSAATAGIGAVDCGGGVACSPSCSGMSGTECQGDDCCASPLVPGGTFERTTTVTFTATVSSFRLDKFEVTVARYRNFAAVRDEWRAAGNPVAGAGEHPHIPGTGWDKAWEQEWGMSAFGPSDCSPTDPPRGTYVDVGQDTLPANCVTWAQAFEFCVWDGGRLPTDTEWEYAAVGGPLQYSYPWGDAPVLSGLPDGSAAYAVYGNLGDGSAAEASFADILPVGSRAPGAGQFGQMDLAGSMGEWTLDNSPVDLPVSMAPVTDWAAFDPRVGTSAMRGGDWSSDPEDLVVTLSRFAVRQAHDPQIGFRCARAP